VVEFNSGERTKKRPAVSIPRVRRLRSKKKGAPEKEREKKGKKKESQREKKSKKKREKKKKELFVGGYWR